MIIGFIGAGTLTKTLGRHFTNAGHRVLVSNSRGPASLSDIVAALGPLAKAVEREEVLEADLVVLATNWAASPKSA